MWFYLYPHSIYHLTRWFPKNNRVKFRLLVFLLSVIIVIPQFIVLNQPNSSRACDQPLLDILVASIIFIFFSIAFAMLFSILDPVPVFLKNVFHVFGLASFGLGIFTAIYTFQASTCRDSTLELYYWCFTSAILFFISTGYFMFTIPFWVINKARSNSVLDLRKRKGFCYEPVSYCSCFWHV